MYTYIKKKIYIYIYIMYIYLCIFIHVNIYIYMYIFKSLRSAPPCPTFRTVSSAADVLAAEQTAVEALNLFVAAQVASG